VIIPLPDVSRKANSTARIWRGAPKNLKVIASPLALALEKEALSALIHGKTGALILSQDAPGKNLSAYFSVIPPMLPGKYPPINQILADLFAIGSQESPIVW
jgi:hypothetical protein